MSKKTLTKYFLQNARGRSLLALIFAPSYDNYDGLGLSDTKTISSERLVRVSNFLWPDLMSQLWLLSKI